MLRCRLSPTMLHLPTHLHCYIVVRFISEQRFFFWKVWRVTLFRLGCGSSVCQRLHKERAVYERDEASVHLVRIFRLYQSRQVKQRISYATTAASERVFFSAFSRARNIVKIFERYSHCPRVIIISFIGELPIGFAIAMLPQSWPLRRRAFPKSSGPIALSLNRAALDWFPLH